MQCELPAPDRAPGETQGLYFERLFRATPAPLLVIQADSLRFTVTEVNDAYLALTLRRREDVVGRGIFEVFPDNPLEPGIEGISTLRASFERVIASRRPDTVTGLRYDIARPDGTFEARWWSPVNSPVLSANGDVKAIIHHAIDVTQQFQAEAELRRRKENLELALQATDLAVYEWDLIGDRMIINERFRKMVGIDGDQPDVGARILEHCIHPDDRARINSAFARAIDSTSSGQFVFEHRLSRRDPRGEPWVLCHGQVCFLGSNADRRPVRVLGTLQDITDRKQAELKLRDAEVRQRHLIDSWAQAVWETNGDGLVTADSPSWRAYTGQTLEEWLGYGWLHAIHPDDRAYAERQWREAVAARGFVNAEFRLRAPDGGWRWTNVRAAPLLDAEGRIEKWVGMNVDISDHKRAEQALREADSRKEEFLATLAHELRNPLATIRNALRLLRANLDRVASERVNEMLERQVNHMVRLLDDLLDVSRISRGAIELRREPLDLAKVVRDAVEASSPAIDRAGHTFEVVLPDEPISVVGDALRLAQVLSNLLSNAARYTDPGGHIKLVARRNGANALVEVSDSGIGIAPEQLPHVFAMFAQINRCDARSQGGLGIGLALAQSLAQMHGGVVEAHSEGLGHGSRFTLRLPRVE